MKPILYPADEKTFLTYGLGEINAIKAIATRERNGNYTLYIEYPSNGEMASVFQREMKIKSDVGVRTKNQTFEISRINKNSDGIVKIYAKHISHKAEQSVLNPNVSISGASAQDALSTWNANLIGGLKFDVWSDIETNNSTNWKIEEITNAHEALLGKRGSILDVWGGEYEFDNMTIKLHKQLGRKTPTVLEYGRNIVSAESDEDIESTVTSILPFAVYTPANEEGNSSESEIVTLDEKIIDGDYLDLYANRRIATIDLSSKFKQDEVPTQDKLRSIAESYVKNNRIGMPKINTKIEYIDLSTTLDYQSLKLVEEIELCDIVPIFYPKLGITSEDAKVVVVNYNVLLDRNDSIEVGTIGSGFRSALIGDIEDRLFDLENRQENLEDELPKYLVNSQGNRIWYDTPPPNIEHKIGDTWFEKNGKYHRIYVWNGETWEKLIDTETFDREIQEKINAFESKVKEFDEQFQATQERNQSELDAFRKELDSLDLPTDVINEMEAKINALRDRTEMSLDLIGNDGVTRYNKNLLKGEFKRKVLFDNPITEIVANDGGFKAGQTYTISFDAICEMLQKAILNVHLEAPSEILKAQLKLVPERERLETFEVESSSHENKFNVIADEPYQITVSGDWYQEQTFKHSIHKNETKRIELQFKEVADGNLDNNWIGNWSSEAKLILNGGRENEIPTVLDSNGKDYVIGNWAEQPEIIFNERS